LEGNKIVLTPLKTYMIGKLYQDELKNYIEEGRNFENDDYIINDPNQKVSIILGNEYKDVYKLGDVITISLHEKPLKFKVIGFFEKNTKIYINGEYLFDQSIIMPYYNISYDPVDDTDEIYQKIYYSQKNEGFIKINEENTDDIETVKANYINKVEELARKYDLLYTIIGSPFSINFRQK